MAIDYSKFLPSNGTTTATKSSGIDYSKFLPPANSVPPPSNPLPSNGQSMNFEVGAGMPQDNPYSLGPRINPTVYSPNIQSQNTINSSIQKGVDYKNMLEQHRQETTSGIAKSAMLVGAPELLMAAGTAPVATAAGLGIFTGLQKVADKFNLHLANLLPEDASNPAKVTADVLETVGLGLLSHGIIKSAPAVGEAFTKNLIDTYNLPKQVFIPAETIKDIFQTGTKATPEQLNQFTAITGGDPVKIKQAIQNGLDVAVPAQKVTQLVDKPYWAKIKDTLGIAPTNESNVMNLGETTQAPHGYLEVPKGNIDYSKFLPKSETPVMSENVAKPLVTQEAQSYPKSTSIPVNEGQTPSGIGKSIETKAIEAGLTKGFGNVAGYDASTIKEQARLSADLINSGMENVRAVINGEQPLPVGLKGGPFIVAMEDYLAKNPDLELQHALANSPLTSGASESASELGLMQNRIQDSANAKLQEIKKSLIENAGGKEKVASAKTKIIKQLKEIDKVKLTKDEASWDKFLSEIQC